MKKKRKVWYTVNTLDDKYCYVPKLGKFMAKKDVDAGLMFAERKTKRSCERLIQSTPYDMVVTQHFYKKGKVWRREEVIEKIY